MRPHDTITIVIPWFGYETAGGAETQARQLAQAIHSLGVPIEVWTTTARDSFAPSAAYYPVGPTTVDGVAVRRFPFTPPSEDFAIPPIVRQHAATAMLTPFPREELRLLASLVSSDALLEAIVAERATRQFLFVLYAFPTSFWGTLLAGERAHLLPCLHDEPYARYSTYRWMFRQARRMLANSRAEGALAHELYDLSHEQIVVAGEGIDLKQRGDGAAFRARHHLQGPLLMYAGRRDEGKNFPLLLAYVREYWARRGTGVTFIVTGRDPFELPSSMRGLVLDLGYVSVQEKADAFAAADVYVHASTNESFSIVMMEAWLQGTPVLVNEQCAVTREAVENSAGGLSFSSFAEFAAALDMLLADPMLRSALGRNGQAYVLDTCRWEDVAQRTIAALTQE